MKLKKILDRLLERVLRRGIKKGFEAKPQTLFDRDNPNL